jgi:hypothetical protein
MNTNLNTLWAKVGYWNEFKSGTGTKFSTEKKLTRKLNALRMKKLFDKVVKLGECHSRLAASPQVLAIAKSRLKTENYCKILFTSSIKHKHNIRINIGVTKDPGNQKKADPCGKGSRVCRHTISF